MHAERDKTPTSATRAWVMKAPRDDPFQRLALGVRFGEIRSACRRPRSHRFGQRDRDARPLARQDLRTVEVAAVGDDIAAFRLQRRLCFLGHARELGPVSADVGHPMRDDELMLRVDSGLHVVADDSGASAAGRRRARVGICLRDLTVRCGEHRTTKRGADLLADTAAPPRVEYAVTRKTRHFEAVFEAILTWAQG